MEKKYKITVHFNNGTSNYFVGLGRPNSTLDEIQIKSPDGEEIIVLKKDVRLFVVDKYEG